MSSQGGDASLRLRFARALEFIEVLMDEADELKDKNEELKDWAHRQAKSDRKKRDEEFKLKIKELETQLQTALDSKSASSRKAIEEAEAARKKAQDELAEFRNTHESRVEKYRADAAKAREQVRIVADERARLQAVADELRDSNRRVEELQDQVSRLQTELKKTRKNAANAMSTKKLHELTSSLQAALTTEKEQRMEMEHEYGAMAAERDALLAERNHLRDMVEQMQAHIKKLENDRLGSRFKEYVTLKSSNERLADQIEKIKREKHRSKRRLHSVKSNPVLAPGGVRVAKGGAGAASAASLGGSRRF